MAVRKKVRVAIIGVGNCASFDVVKTKVGKDLSQAISSYPNNTIQFTDVPRLNVRVHRGMTHDGLGTYLASVVEKAEGPTDDIVRILKQTKTDVVVNYLPVFIASSDYWAGRFRERRLPIIGDDIKSQVGATIAHRVLTNLFNDRGVRLDRTYQLNFGGNMDFYNMLDRGRLESKKISKTNAVTSQLPYTLPPENVHVGPSDYVPWLTDRKWCYIRMEGTTFGDVPLNLELKLEVWD